jgi:pimeloyl-ACP methyl ester carboxylesterase
MVAVDGVRLRTLVWDPPRHRRTPPTIALAGLTGSASDFDPLAGALRTDRTVIGVELPGVGKSEQRGPYDPIRVADRIAELVLHVMEGRSGDGRVDVVGQGIAGNVAIALAGTRPDLVRRLVVINAPYRTRHVPLPRQRPRLHRPSAPGIGRLRVLGTELAWLRGHLATRSALPDVAVERTLMVWGSDDRWLAPLTSVGVLGDLARGTPDSRQVTIPGGGHRPHVTAPEAVSSAVAEFLRA